MRVFLIFLVICVGSYFIINILLAERSKNHSNKFLDKLFVKYKILNTFFNIEKQGWTILIAKTSLNLIDLSTIDWNKMNVFSLTDNDCSGVADPFLIKEGERYYLFFEYEYKRKLNKGADLAYASSLDGKNWEFQRKIIPEKFHQSFPFVFKENNQYYLLPETNEAGEIRLYVAVEFPNTWKLDTVLYAGGKFVDTVFLKKDAHYYWLTTDLKTGELHLFYSTSFKGTWHKHPSSPISVSLKNNRNAGPIFVNDGKIYRVAQDGRAGYGSGVNLYEITKIDEFSYKEALLKEPLFYKSENHTKDAMHHLSVLNLNTEKLIAIDGANFAAKGIKLNL